MATGIVRIQRDGLLGMAKGLGGVLLAVWVSGADDGAGTQDLRQTGVTAGKTGIKGDGLQKQRLGLIVGLGRPQARQLMPAQPQVIGHGIARRAAGMAQQRDVVDLACKVRRDRPRDGRADLLQLILGHGKQLGPDLAAVSAIYQGDEQLALGRPPVQHAVHREIGVDRAANGGKINGAGRVKAGSRPGNDDPAAKARQAGLGQKGKAVPKIILAGVGIARQRRADRDPGRAAS